MGNQRGRLAIRRPGGEGEVVGGGGIFGFQDAYVLLHLVYSNILPATSQSPRNFFP